MCGHCIVLLTVLTWAYLDTRRLRTVIDEEFETKNYFLEIGLSYILSLTVRKCLTSHIALSQPLNYALLESTDKKTDSFAVVLVQACVDKNDVTTLDLQAMYSQ